MPRADPNAFRQATQTFQLAENRALDHGGIVPAAGSGMLAIALNQQLDPEEWPQICFEGELLPQTVSAIHILIDQPFSERMKEWVWRLPHCKGVWKEGDAAWCAASASELADHMLEHRDGIIREIEERLGTDGFDGPTTLQEWLKAMSQIQGLANRIGGICRWVAGAPSPEAEEQRRRVLRFLDENGPEGE